MSNSPDTVVRADHPTSALFRARSRPLGPASRPAAAAEAELAERLAEEHARGALRHRLRKHPLATFSAAVAILQLVLRLPRVSVRLPRTEETPAVRRMLRSYRIDKLLTLGAAAVLPIPPERGEYLLGHERATVRRKVRAAQRVGTSVRAVAEPDRARLLALADEHERNNERAEYRTESPNNRDLLGYDLWLAAYAADGTPIVLTVIPYAGAWSVLRHFRTLVASPASSDARYLLAAELVEELRERGVRHLVDPLPPRWLPSGLRHFQRMLGFRLIRLRQARTGKDLL